MYTRKEAWALAKQIRTCPPPEIRANPLFYRENTRHQAICPFCSTGLNQDVDAWRWLSSNRDIGAHEAAVGQLCRINPGLSQWYDGYFYNAPIVLILKKHGTAGQTVSVAQVWHDLYLAAPGDLVVPEDLIKGWDGLVIETWNQYDLNPKDLTDCLGSVDMRVVTAVFDMNQTPGYLPNWAPLPMPLKTDDLRQHFRLMEATAARLFSTSSRTILSLKNLMGVIREQVSGADWPWPPRTVDECMATLRFPFEKTPMAAAGKDQNEILANVFIMDRGIVLSVFCIVFPVLHDTFVSGDQVLTGQIPASFKLSDSTIIQCFRESEKKKNLINGRFSLDQATGYFMARLQGKPGSSDRVRILILDENIKSS